MSEAISAGILVIFGMLLLYMIMGTYIEKFECAFGHEASWIIIVGKSSQ